MAKKRKRKKRSDIDEFHLFFFMLASLIILPIGVSHNDIFGESVIIDNRIIGNAASRQPTAIIILYRTINVHRVGDNKEDRQPYFSVFVVPCGVLCHTDIAFPSAQFILDQFLERIGVKIFKIGYPLSIDYPTEAGDNFLVITHEIDLRIGCNDLFGRGVNHA